MLLKNMEESVRPGDIDVCLRSLQDVRYTVELFFSHNGKILSSVLCVTQIIQILVIKQFQELSR